MILTGQKNARRAFVFAVFGCLMLMFSSLGCATVRGEKFTYQTLPKHLVASVRENPQTVDLTRLASATTSSDVLDVGDVVEVTIAAGLNEKETVHMPIRIHDDGYGDLPEIGLVKLAGLKVTAAEAEIVHQCVSQGLYRSPKVTLLMKEQRTNRIMVAGAVKKPSIYELPRGQCDLLSALSKAEGLDPSAGTQVIIRNLGTRSIARPDSVAGNLQNGIDPVGHRDGVDSVGHSAEFASRMSDTIRVDLVSATKNGTGGYQLEDGAVVYVEKRDPEPLHVIGLVNKPGRFEFPIAEELRVTDAIALAGGISSVAADKIFVIRRRPSDQTDKTVDLENPDRVKTFIVQVSLANAKQQASSNLRLAPGDVVSVEQTATTFIIDRIMKTGFNIAGSIPLLTL